MIWMLRRISVQFWITVLLGAPACFVINLLILHLFSGASTLVISVFVIAATAGGSGFFMDLYGQKTVARLIKEGQTWERSGIHAKAQKRYIRAMRIYDTFLLWPGSARKAALQIAKSVASFYLNAPGSASGFTSGTCAYLKMNPEDESLALLWLEQIHEKKVLDAIEQDLLTVLAQQYEAHPQVVRIIAEIFLMLHRNDLVAKKIYHQALSLKNLDPVNREKILDFITPASAMESDQISEPVVPETVRPDVVKRGVRNHPDIMQGVVQFSRKMSGTAWSLISAIGLLFKKIAETATVILARLVLVIESGVQLFKEDQRMRRLVRNGVLAITASGLVFFLVTTVFHTLKTRVKERQRIAREAAIPKPFTIQVAAYRKHEHAKRYVEKLKKNEVEAVVKMVEGGGKTWFVVHVSTFPDKKSAARYGQELKTKKMIDDFFVNNR